MNMAMKAEENVNLSEYDVEPQMSDSGLETDSGNCQEETVFHSQSLPKEEKRTTMKLIVLLCLLNGFAWVWCSYILAWMGKEQIAESLSQVALTEIIGVVLVYAVKSVFENLSKNNSWPDKPGSDPPDGAG